MDSPVWYTCYGVWHCAESFGSDGHAEGLQHGDEEDEEDHRRDQDVVDTVGFVAAKIEQNERLLCYLLLCYLLLCYLLIVARDVHRKQSLILTEN
jgi:hypothetical protein